MSDESERRTVSHLPFKRIKTEPTASSLQRLFEMFPPNEYEELDRFASRFFAKAGFRRLVEAYRNEPKQAVAYIRKLLDHAIAIDLRRPVGEAGQRNGGEPK